MHEYQIKCWQLCMCMDTETIGQQFPNILFLKTLLTKSKKNIYIFPAFMSIVNNVSKGRWVASAKLHKFSYINMFRWHGIYKLDKFMLHQLFGIPLQSKLKIMITKFLFATTKVVNNPTNLKKLRRGRGRRKLLLTGRNTISRYYL